MPRKRGPIAYHAKGLLIFADGHRNLYSDRVEMRCIRRQFLVAYEDGSCS